MTGTLLELFRHKTWATLRLIEYCQGLADEHLDSTIPRTFGTIRPTRVVGISSGRGRRGSRWARDASRKLALRLSDAS
jgi:hypothetical protein